MTKKDQDTQTQPGATPSGDEADKTPLPVDKNESGSEGGVQSDDAADNQTDLERAEVPPELEETKKNLLRDYHGKLAEVKREKDQFQSDLAVAKRDSVTLQKLFQQEWFRKAMDTEKGKKAGAALPFELSDEQFDAVRTDKRAFLELVRQVAKNMTESELGDKVSQLHETTESLRAEREFDAAASEYGEEFQSFNDEGKLDPYLNQGFDYATSFEKAKMTDLRKNGNGGTVRKEAEELLRARKQQSVEKGGGGRVSGSRVIKAKTWSEAVSKSLDALLSGEKDFKLSKD